jgi:response regulator of citrate/malate metabolism
MSTPIVPRISSTHLIILSSLPPLRLGVVATKKMRDAGYKGLIIGMSGDNSCTSFLQSGANNFLLKPLCRKELTNALVSDESNKNTTTISSDVRDET